MAFINVNGQWVPVEGRAERAVLNSGINAVPRPSLKVAAPTVRTFNENNVTPKTAPANIPAYNAQEMFKAASYSNRFDGLGGAPIKEAATDPAINVELKADKPTKVIVVKKPSSRADKKKTPMKKESWVMDLQKTINAETGANLVEDGKWGPKTEAAYKVYAGKINDSKNSAQNAPLAQLPVEGLAATAAPKEVGFWERLFQDDRTPEQKAAEQQAVVDKILGGDSGNTGLAAAQYGR